MTTLHDKQLKILNLLRNLYDQCRTEYVKLNLAEKAKEYEIQNPSNFAPLLVQTGILSRQGNNPAHYTYKWASEYAPNVEMIEKHFGDTKFTTSKSVPKTEKIPVPLAKTVKTTEPKETLDPLEILPTSENRKHGVPDFYSDADLIEELKTRGYKGSLTLAKQVTL